MAKKILESTILTLLIIFLGGCGEEFSVTTTVLPRGGIERQVAALNAGAKAPAEWWPHPVDQSWQTGTHEIKKENQVQYRHWAKKSFSTAAELRGDFDRYPRDGSWLLPEISWTKRWRGFYTHYSYRESYQVPPLFLRLPLSSALSPAEINLVSALLENEEKAKESHPRSEIDRVSETFLDWVSRCLAEDFYLVLLDAAQKSGDHGLTPGMVRERHETIVGIIREKIDDSGEERLRECLQQTEALFPATAWKILVEKNPGLFDAFKLRRRFFYDGIITTYPFQVSMPGLIVSTNSNQVQGNVVSWKMSGLRLAQSGFDMKVESRRINWWAIGGAGFLLLLVLGLLLRTLWSRGR